MRFLVTYDVETLTKAGRKRLRKIAKECESFGQRVQLSVFEIDVPPEKWVRFRHHLLQLIDEKVDSVRFYPLDEDMYRRVEHHGCKKPVDLDGLLIV